MTNPEQHLINHLIDEHLRAPWYVREDTKGQHAELHQRDCGHTHAATEQAKEGEV